MVRFLLFGTAFLCLNLKAYDFKNDIKPLLEKYCYKCHDADVQKGDLRLDQFNSEDGLIKERKMWLQGLDLIKQKEMPPKKPFPSQLELEKLTTYLDKVLNNYDWSKIKNPGFVSLARMTNAEYQNSVSNVFDLKFHKKVSLIQDSEGDSGFTNDRDNLGLSTNALLKYIEEAEQYVDAFLAFQRPQWNHTFDLTEGGKKKVVIGHNKSTNMSTVVPFTGIYKLSIDAASVREQKTGIEVYINNQLVFNESIEGNDVKEYSIPVFLKKGAVAIVAYYSVRNSGIYRDDRITVKVPQSVHQASHQAGRNAPKIQIPARFKNNKNAGKAVAEINKKILFAWRAMTAAKMLTKLDPIPDDRGIVSPLDRVLKTKDAAKLLKIPEKEVYAVVKQELGRDIRKEASEILKKYNKKYYETYGHRFEKAGQLRLDNVKLSGPYLTEGSKDPKRFLNKPKSRDYAYKLFYYYAVKAFKRQVSKEDLTPVLSVYDKIFKHTNSHDIAFRDALVSLITSPKFMLHRNELPKSGTEIDDFQKVSRLSYFLWQTIPDSTLLRMAKNNTIKDPKNLRTQLQRMIADPQFKNFTKTFASEWLNINSLKERNDISEYIKKLMVKEPEMLIHKVFSENRNIFELIDPGYTFANDVLAKYYDIQGISGSEMKLVKLKDNKRGGLLSMAGVLSSNSLPRRTSPVHRGAWIVETILGEELPLPPDNVPELPDRVPGAKTLREKLEVHRKDPNCASCHARIDPYGFALENYDHIGRWRDTERHGTKIDSSMILKDGKKSDDIAGFKRYLMKAKKDDIRRNLIERVLSYALGRKLQYYDTPAILKIIDKMKKHDDKAFFLIEGVVESYPFQNQKLQEEDS